MKVVTAAQMVRIEQEAINNYGIPSILLMENAALAVLEAISEILGTVKGKRITVLAGKGNNGGDGLALARHLVNRGAEVQLFLCAQEDMLKNDSLTNYKLLKGLELEIFAASGETELKAFELALMTCDLAVDALYGTGFRGALPPVQESYVKALNDAGKPVVAVDIPSGVEADTGKVYKEAVRAVATVTFGLPKLGQFLKAGPEYTGKLHINPISIPAGIRGASTVATSLLTAEYVGRAIPSRSRYGHKGTHGTGLIIGGSPGMSGALALAAKAALRSGAGLVRMATGENMAQFVDGLLEEATTIGLKETPTGRWATGAFGQLKAALASADAVGVGPGLGQNNEILKLLNEIVEQSHKPLVIDADGLNALAQDIQVLLHANGPVILTPHPGEMARLTGLNVEEVQANRLELALEKASQWGVILVLKGAATIVASPDGRAFINTSGGPILGAGGTGDVLTGCIVGLLAQGVEPLDAACLGVYCHGLAGDIIAAEITDRGALAGEVADKLPQALAHLNAQ